MLLLHRLLPLLLVLMAAIVLQQCAPGGRLHSNSSTSNRLLRPLIDKPISAPAQQQQHRCTGLPWINKQQAQRLTPAHAGQHTGPSGSGDAGDRAPSHNKHNQQRPGPLQSLFRKLVLMLRLSGTVALLVAAFPYLLSSRLGTSLAAAAASRVLPGDVQIQRLSLGWAQPLAVHGLAIYEGAAGSSRQLVGLQRFSSAEPLYQVVTGSADHLTLTLSNPSVDCSLTDTGDNFRIVRYLEQSQLLRILTGKRSAPAPAPTPAAGTNTAQPGCSTSKAAAAVEVRSHPIQVSETAAADDEVGADAGSDAASSSADKGGAATAAGAKQPATAKAADAAAAAAATSSSSSSSPSGLPANFIQRLAQADASSQVSAELRLPMLSVYIPDGQLLLPQGMAAAMGSHIHAVAAAGTSAVEDLASELDEDCSWLQAQQQQQQQQQPASKQQQLPQPATRQQEQQEQGQGQDAAHASWQLPPPSVSRKAWAHATPIMLQVSGERVAALVRGWHLGSIWRLSKSSFLLQQPATADWEFTPELAKLTLSQFNPLLEEVALIRESGQLMTSIAPAEGRLPAERGQLYVSPVKLVVGKGNLLSQIYRLLGLHGRFGSHGASPSHQHPWLSGSSSGSTTAAAAAKEAAAAADDDGAALQGLEVWSGPLRVQLEGPGKFRTDRVDMLLGTGRNSLHVALWGTVDTNSNTLEMSVGLPAETLAKAGLKGLPPGYMLPVAVSGPLHRPQVEWNAAVRQLAVLSAMQLGREAWKVEGERAAGALWGAVTHEEGAAAVPAGIAGLLGAANRALSKAASSFIGQVDERLQSALQNVPPPAELPWEQDKPARHDRAGWHAAHHHHHHQQQQSGGGQ